MNRADQALEPSMEELLTSIRVIISDASKSGGSQKAAGISQPESGQALKLTAEAEAEPEDVLELTEEQVSPALQVEPLEGPALISVPHFPGPAETAKPDATGEKRVGAAPVEEAGFAVPQGITAPYTSVAAPSRPRGEPRANLPPPSPQPLWSRRDMPRSAGGSRLREDMAQPAGDLRPREEVAPVKSPPGFWPGDIHMPVPEQGPVSLLDAASGRASPEPTGKGARATPALPKHKSPVFERVNKEEAAAVAALAQNLARSAAGALNSTELEDAGEVDFQKLDEASKTNVSEKFADAIERESGNSIGTELPILLDEVFRHDFIRTASASQSKEADDELQAEIDPGASAGQIPRAGQARNVMASGTGPGAGQPRWTDAAPSQEPQHPVQSAAASKGALQPFAQAQLAGHAQTLPISSKNLEDAVREMLRPLLLQWLNENMPRILENAIREEIAIRGIFPK
jgi:cell pole-organizing protein PopZ